MDIDFTTFLVCVIEGWSVEGWLSVFTLFGKPILPNTGLKEMRSKLIISEPFGVEIYVPSQFYKLSITYLYHLLNAIRLSFEE